MHKASSFQECATRLWQTIIARSMFVGMLALGMALPGTALGGEKRQFQPILCKPDQNDTQLESAECLERFKELANRDGDVLRLNLANGTTKVYKGDRNACGAGAVSGECLVFQLIAFYPSVQSFLVEKGFDECRYYELVSRQSGDIVELSTVPEWSANGKYLVSVNDNSDLCRPFDYLVILSATDPPTLELKHHIEGYENWTIAGWDDDRIKLQVDVGEPQGTYNQDVVAVRFGDGWNLVWGQISNVVPHESASQWTPGATPRPGTSGR